jgi:arsenate reductase (glutaredoxin)
MKARLYGIRNCDTVNRARAWLEAQSVAVDFHDFKSDGVPQKLLESWIARAGWEALVNRRGLTWRRLAEERRAQVVDAGSATALMLESPSVIKRPLLETGARLVVGFDESEYASLFRRAQ